MNFPTLNAGRVLHGDCIDLMQKLPNSCVDLIVTDPPYLVNYRSRDGRTIANDGSSAWLDDAFSGMFRVLKPNSFCVSFYGWSRVELFMRAWKRAGFTPVAHLVWTKSYASKRGFVASHHEQAFLLAKGQPDKPSRILRDVLPWKYSGNRLHPTQKPLIAVWPLIKALSRPGDLVLDPFAGSGTTLVTAALLGRRYLGMEILAEYWKTACGRLKALEQGKPPASGALPRAEILSSSGSRELL